MIYRSPFRDIIYPARNREPRVTCYRIMLAKNARLVRAIVHLMAEQPEQPLPTDSTALDVILNRIIGAELAGVRHDCIRLIVQAAGQMTDYPIVYNALDVSRPGNVTKRQARTTDHAWTSAPRPRYAVGRWESLWPSHPFPRGAYRSLREL